LKCETKPRSRSEGSNECPKQTSSSGILAEKGLSYVLGMMPWIIYMPFAASLAVKCFFCGLPFSFEM
jgi:hypothetical protein